MGQLGGLRACGIRVDPRRGPGAQRRPQAEVRDRVDQHPHPAHARDAARRLWAERVRQGHVHLLGRGVHPDQARHGGDRLMATGTTGATDASRMAGTGPRPFYVAGQWRTGERVDDLAEMVAREGGKPLKWSKVEVTRASSTFRWAAEETRRFGGEF